MPNAWVHPTAIAADALMHLEDSLVIGNLAARDKTGEFVGGGMKIGDQVNIKTRPDFEAKEFTNDGVNTIEVQSVRESQRPFAIEKILDVSVEITAKEKALELDAFSEQVILPAAYRLAEKVDVLLGTKILLAAGQYNSSALLGSAADIALARKAANLQQLDFDRFCLVNDTAEATLLGQTWFNQSQTRGAPGIATLQSGLMGHVMGMDFVSSINFPDSTATAGAGTSQTENTIVSTKPTTNLIGMSVLTMDSLTNGITAGDRIAIAGVRRPLIANATVTAGATSVALVDPITEIIPDNAAISVVASGATHTAQGAIFDGQSLAIAMPFLDAPSDKPSAVATNQGYSCRIVQGYDIDRKVEVMSLDLMVGTTCWDPRRITLLTDS